MPSEKTKKTGVKPSAKMSRGLELLHDPVLNKGTAFTEAERDKLGLRGLLPPHVHTQDEQVLRVMKNFRRKPDDLERYIHLISLQDRNETLFYRVILENLEEMMPIIYTPTVGKACQQYGYIFRRPRGIYLSANDKGRMAELLKNWPQKDVRIIVVTDGERILGLGDLGTFGMGIPVGKLALYTACAGVHPSFCLPVLLDFGTDNEALLKDELYTGLRQRRQRGDAYDELVDEFVQAAQKAFPDCLIQFEDFANTNAFRLLRKYQQRVCTFNDDIQGTASVILAGIFSGLRITETKLTDQTILFLGAGEAGIGIGNLIVAAMVEEGLSEDQARNRCWFVDSRGLVVKGRDHLAEHKLPYAHEHEFCPDLLSAIESLRPTALIGVSGSPRAFTRPIVEAMARHNRRPFVFALSNPTSKAECTAEEAYFWSEGRAIFACGSPFPPVNFNDKTFIPGQGNNAYIFPGVGLGVISCKASHVTNQMFFAAAKALAQEVSEADLDQGRIYPSLTRMRDVSATIAKAVIEVAYAQGLARVARPDDLMGYIQSQVYKPVYRSYAP